MHENKLEPLFKSSLTKIILTILWLVSFVIFLKPILSPYYQDFSSYYVGASMLAHGGNPYLAGNNGAFLYPPFALLFFFPLTFLPLIIAGKVFVIFSISCLFVSLLILLKLFKISFTSVLGIFLLTLVFNFFPEKFTLGMGQINNVILLLICLFVYCYIKKKDHLAGIFLAFAIMLKLTPLILIFMLLIDKRWKMLLTTIITLLCMIIIVVIFVPSTATLYFLQTTLPGLGTSWKGDYYNQALSGFLQRDLPDLFLRQTLRTILSALLFLASLFFIWRYHKKNDDSRLLSLSLFMTLALIINVFSWQHHFVWLLPPLLIIFMYIKKNHLGKGFYSVLGISYLLVAMNLKNPSVVPVLLQSHVLYGTLMLYGLNLYLLIKSHKNT